MNYKRFLEITQESWNDYFKIVQENISRGIMYAKTKEGGEAIILFPSILLITETKRHYAAELLGVKDIFNGLKLKTHKEASIARYLNQFSTDESHPFVAAARDDCENIGFADLTISHSVEYEKLKARFPFIYLYETSPRLIHHPNASGALFSAVGGKQVIYEPYLDWIEKPSETPIKPINPDLMIEREDGFYDIYELKTALLNKTSLTKGDRSRRRFIDYVEEGIAQLANYEEYFTYSKNCDYALNKYGIKVKEPNLVLVVGNFDNVNKIEIEEASRRLKNVTIIDYDSFLQLFLSSEKLQTPNCECEPYSGTQISSSRSSYH